MERISLNNSQRTINTKFIGPVSEDHPENNPLDFFHVNVAGNGILKHPVQQDYLSPRAQTVANALCLTDKVNIISIF